MGMAMQTGSVICIDGGKNHVTAVHVDDAARLYLLAVRDITRQEAEAQIGKTFAWFLSAENRASGAKAVKDLGWHPSGVAILDDINQGSYQALAQELRK